MASFFGGEAGLVWQFYFTKVDLAEFSISAHSIIQRLLISPDDQERIPTPFRACYNVVMDTAEWVIATLRTHEAELRQAGLRSLSLFGSVARGETETDSDIDLAAEFEPAARMDLLKLTALERRIAELLGSPVDLLPEPVEKRRLQDQINRDRRRAF